MMLEHNIGFEKLVLVRGKFNIVCDVLCYVIHYDNDLIPAIGTKIN
jgi:hypothetical protein